MTSDNNKGKWIKLSLIFVIYVAYITYLSVVRPFKVWADNAVEITISVAIALLLSMFFYLNSEDKWNDTAFGFFVAIFVLALVLSIGFYIGKFVISSL